MEEKACPAVDVYPEILLLIPTRNEEEAIKDLLREANSTGFSNILVVDGFSSDQTRGIASAMGARVVLQEFGKGKGCGVRTGMRLFLEGNFKFLSIIDGDGTNNPSYLPKMFQFVKSGEADVVLGSRTRGPRDKNSMDTLSLVSNLTLSFLLGAKFGRHFTDIQTGYWLFTREAVERIYPEIQSSGFEIELELFVKIIRERLRIMEVPVSFRTRKGVTKFSFMLRIRNLCYAFKYLAS
ncbi:MAG: glycosyltransferase family 2 protein [Candidatus Bathyarchaeia archaeon]|jgi:dolichol-phosphate mannosyltransferase